MNYFYKVEEMTLSDLFYSLYCKQWYTYLKLMLLCDFLQTPDLRFFTYGHDVNTERQVTEDNCSKYKLFL